MSYKNPADKAAYKRVARIVKQAAANTEEPADLTKPKRRIRRIKTAHDLVRVLGAAIGTLQRNESKMNPLAYSNSLRSLAECWLKANAETSTADEIKLLKEQLRQTKAK